MNAEYCRYIADALSVKCFHIKVRLLGRQDSFSQYYHFCYHRCDRKPLDPLLSFSSHLHECVKLIDRLCTIMNSLEW
jgi:hypothetical protein